MQDADSLTILFLLEHLQDALDQSIYTTEDEKELLMLESPSVMLKVFQADWEELANNYEADQVVDVAYVQLTNESLHLGI